MKGDISHRGKVTSVTAATTTVEIISQSACAACHAKTLCGLSENVTKTVDVRTIPGQDFQVGEEVQVVLSRVMGHKAVWLSYVIPLVILISLILLCSFLSVNEFVSGLVAMAGVAAWYFGVWMFRDRLRNEFVFGIEKL